MARTIDFTQIIYRPDQAEKLYSFATPYLNPTLTDYFENAVIADLVPKSTADLISVCSWRLMEKRADCWRLIDKTLSEQKILAQDFDVAILTPRSPNHKALYLASQWHHAAWDNAIADLRTFINIPKEVTHAIYENHFIARREIYHDYVLNCLRPCIDYMKDKEVYFVDAHYINRKRGDDKTRILNILRSELGREDYPIAPFILERLFSIWIEGKKLNVTPL